MQEHEKNCSLCGYEINSPTCVDCLRKQVINFIGNKVDIKQDVEEDIQIFECFDTKKAECIFCDSAVAVCGFCFYRDVYQVLKQRNLKLAEEFARLFQCSGEIQTYLNHYFSSSFETEIV